jgi:predicted TIM-barrel fold metal-dependent hydrolase
MAGGAIYPTLFLWSTWFPHMDSAFAAALARAYNDYIHDFCSVDRKRLFPVIVISLHDPREAIREVERNAKRNFVGVFVRPNPLNGKTLGHPDYFPLYEVMQDLDMPLGIHEGTLAYQPTLGVDRVTTQAGIHIIAHPFEQMAAMLSLYEGGVFERFPRLQTLFLEAGVGWVPWWLHRIDEERKQYRPGSKGELMSTVFARQCFASAEAADENLHRVVEWIGADRLLMSSDYPHDEATFPKTTELFEAQNISPEARELIGRTNPLKAYPRIAKELAQ